MSDATLEMMQEIEQAAQGVIVGYEAQVEQIRTDSRDRLATVAQHYDEETKQLVTEAEKKRPGKTRPFNERSGRNGLRAMMPRYKRR